MGEHNIWSFLCQRLDFLATYFRQVFPIVCKFTIENTTFLGMYIFNGKRTGSNAKNQLKYCKIQLIFSLGTCAFSI